MREFKLDNGVVVVAYVGINHTTLPLGIRLSVENNSEVQYAELHAYPESASGNRDYDYSVYDQKKAEAFYQKARKKVNQKSLPKGFRKE